MELFLRHPVSSVQTDERSKVTDKDRKKWSEKEGKAKKLVVFPIPVRLGPVQYIYRSVIHLSN